LRDRGWPAQANGVVSMKNLLAVILLSLVCVADRAAAQDDAYSNLVQARISKDVGPKWRLGYVNALKTYCSHFAAKVPRNTPNEDSWVEKEVMDSIMDTSLQRRLENSKEYSRYIVRNTLDKCVNLTEKILQTHGNVKEEAALWADLAWQLSGSEDFKKSASVLGLYSASIDPDRVMSYQLIHQTILSKAIMPMLRE
jgi:hypothetical protein